MFSRKIKDAKRALDWNVPVHRFHSCRSIIGQQYISRKLFGQRNGFAFAGAESRRKYGQWKMRVLDRDPFR